MPVELYFELHDISFLGMSELPHLTKLLQDLLPLLLSSLVFLYGSACLELGMVPLCGACYAHLNL